jgi:hypothetical protein
MTKRLVRYKKQVEVWVVLRHDLYDGRIFMDTTTVSFQSQFSKGKADLANTHAPTYAKNNPMVGTVKAFLTLNEDSGLES